jgi:transposase
MREVVNGLMYILSTGCQWRAIPKDLPNQRRKTARLQGLSRPFKLHSACC